MISLAFFGPLLACDWLLSRTPIGRVVASLPSPPRCPELASPVDGILPPPMLAAILPHHLADSKRPNETWPKLEHCLAAIFALTHLPLYRRPPSL